MSIKFNFINKNIKSKKGKIKRHNQSYIPGNARLSMGLYRTPEEAEDYKTKSLKRRLP